MIAKENDQFRQRKRPALYILERAVIRRDRLDSAEAIRRWIPDIKRDIDYFIQQVPTNVTSDLSD